jgi:hypothetical protein
LSKEDIVVFGVSGKRDRERGSGNCMLFFN